MFNDDDVPGGVDQEHIVALVIRYIEKRSGQAAPGEILHLASGLIEHVAYSAAYARPTAETVELLGQALVTAKAAERVKARRKMRST